MSYAIGQVGFGIDLPYHLQNDADKEDFTEIISGVRGVETFYSANGSVTPILIGIKICVIDECSTVDLESLLLKFNNHKDLTSKFEEIREGLIGYIEAEKNSAFNDILEYIKTATPKKIIVWSSS
jgi:hypothetical protein